MTAEEVLDVEVSERVAVVTLRRPQALNAINAELRRGLQETWRRISTDPQICVAVVTGEGSRAFCVGSDLKEIKEHEPSHASAMFGDASANLLLEGLQTDKPLIAAINGLAIGGGLELALACDMRICAETAEFAMAEVRVGSIAGAGGSQRLPRIVGPSLAMQMLLTGERIDAPRALTAGLVSEVLPADQLLDRATELAGRIAGNAPLAVRATKRLVLEGLDLPVDAGMRLERLAWGVIRDTSDRAEGRRAFREKRAPAYIGQ